jgi:uncharacterized repeat protein (TIGR02543 family)
MIFVFFLAIFLFTGCEQPAGNGTPEQQLPALYVFPGNQCLSVSWDNFPGGNVFAGTGDEMPDASEGSVALDGNSAMITELTNNVPYNVWVRGTGGEYIKTPEKAVPVNVSVPAGKFAGSEYIYELDGVIYTKYKNGGSGDITESDIVYSGTIIFTDSDGAMIIKIGKNSAEFPVSTGSYHAVKVTYANKLYKVKESTETPEIPANETGTVTASFGGEYTANIVVGNLVSFDSGSADTEAIPAGIAVETGETAGKLPVPPVKANFQFAGWKKADGSIFTAKTTVDSNITVYAQWTAEVGGIRAFTNIADMANYLESFFADNSAENPVKVVLTSAVSTDDLKTDNDGLGSLFEAFNGKYVTLDMSAVTGEIIEDTEGTIVALRNYKDCLVSIRLPTTLEKIGNYTFKDCASLESVEFPATLAHLGKEAFSGCTALEEALLASTVLTSPADTNGTTGFMSGVFKGCAALSTVTLPDTVTAIWDSTFEGCESLDFDMAFFGNIEKIGASAFKGSGISSFALQEIALLGKNAFENCTKLVTADISSVAGTVTSISDYLFSGCSKLANLSLPATGIKSIGRAAFYGCSELVSVTLPTTLAPSTIVGAIGQSAFANCTKLETVVWTATGGKFNNLFPANGRAFQGCIALKTFTIPEGVIIAGTTCISPSDAPFLGCDSLTSVTLPSSVATITTYFFCGATNLVEINILKPSSAGLITLVNVNAFTDTPFGDQSKTARIYVPDEDSVTAYKAADKWSTFANLILVKPE